MRATERFTDRKVHRLGEEVPDGDIERADRVHRGAATAVPLGALIHLVPQAARVFDRLPDDDVSKPLREMIVGRHLDRGFDDLGRRVALADAHQSVVAVHEHDDVLVAALEAEIGGARILQAEDLHPLNRHSHVEKTRRA